MPAAEKELPARVAFLAPSSSNEARAFLQERLALLGRAYALLSIGFLALEQAALALLRPLTPASGRDPGAWLVLGAAAMTGGLWWTCRRGTLSEGRLLALDAGATLVLAGLNAALVFAPFPGELAGSSQTRALLVVALALVLRSIVVPSTPRRTLALGLAAALAMVVASAVWQGRAGQGAAASVVHVTWTGLAVLGAVAISVVASRAIFGLRQQVREASQLGQYTLLEKIGEGGMGAVYRASHAMLRRPTAVKLLPPGQAGADRLQRFEREVQMTSRLTHPNTVAIFDYGRTPDGIFYYAMEYLEGLNLEDLTRHDGPQSPGRVVHVLRQVCASLAEAHEIGLIHRDVKPANVILVPQRGGAPDVAKVVDFGLVKDLDQDTDLSRDDQIAGTPLYLAPEAITSPGRVGARSDLYSLGCVGYFLLTGKPVFEGRNMVEVCGHHLHTKPLPPAQRLGRPVPEGLSELLLSCLEKDPAERPSYAGEVLETLDRLSEIPPWTNEEARAWWTSRGAPIVARVRTLAKAPRPAGRRQEMSALDTMSFVRGAEPWR